MNTTIDRIPAGEAFALDDLVFRQVKGDAPFTAVAARIDTIVLGPRATADLERPGDDWPAVDGRPLDGIVAGLIAAGRLLRTQSVS